MTERPVLVVGANGYRGSSAIDNLFQRDVEVRALVQTDDERASRLRSRGVEVAIGDVRNLDDVRAVLAGIGAAYFIYPIQPGLIEATAHFAQAPREAGVSAIIHVADLRALRREEPRRA